MSIVPRQSFVEACRDAVLAKWVVPDDLVGRVVNTIQELREKCPADALYLEPELVENIPKGSISKGFALYTRSLKADPQQKYKVAYECGDCSTIIIGPPRIRAVDAGRKALEYYCVRCNAYLQDIPFGWD